jgi:subtilisin family serine protease
MEGLVMKTLLALVVLVAFAGEARAERWIVKNPASPLVNANAIRSFEFGGDRYVVVETPKFSPLMASAEDMSDSVVEDLVIQLPAEETAPAEPTVAQAWHPAKMKYNELPSDKDGTGVVVAVLDTGVDYSHPSLKDFIWTNPGEIAGNSIDDDGNGFVDDVHGFDFSSDDSDPTDGDAHGTHVAGTIASAVDPQSGAVGVAPGAKVMAVRIIGDERMGFISDAVAGIKYSVDNGAKILSNSWRVYRSWNNFDPSDQNIELLRKAIEYAGEKGAIFVAAAGNEGRNIDSHTDAMYPGGYTGLSNLLVVAASDSKDLPAYFSNFGIIRVTVAAPGVDIVSTVPGGRFASMSGTSMATPLVSGVLARGMSASYAPSVAMEKLIATTAPLSPWATKVKAGGVISIVDYLK